MWKEGCQVELSIYDTSGWWSVFSVIKPLSLAIKYDTGLYVVYKNHMVVKVKEKKILSKITFTEKEKVGCRAWLVGKIWLDNCIISGKIFEDAKEFAREYVKVVGSI